MNTKVIIAALAGSVFAFLLGWLIFGNLLEPFYQSQMVDYPGLMRDEATMRLWAIYLANLAWSGLLAYAMNRWGGPHTFLKGFVGGFILMGLGSLGSGLMSFAQMNLCGYQLYIVDVLASAGMGGLVGGVIAIVLGRNSTATA